MTTRERHKAMAIPVSMIDNVRHFLLVRDRRYKEWTFVTGGCRRREIFNPLQCAVRELEEETRGTINLKKGSYSYFKFVTDTPEQRDIDDGVAAHNTYHVYIFDLPMTEIEHSTIIQQFTSEKNKMEASRVPYRRNYDENDDCSFETLDSISSRSNIWPMVRKHVLENPEFITALETNKTSFNLSKNSI
jgi:ADP-ribose pyrophosphatase YjhB (NUDIX family)